MRKFKTGAVRDSDQDKLDFIGSLSPIVLLRFAEYMKSHRKLTDGSRRSDGNWKKGMTQQSFIESLTRHFIDLWLDHEGYRKLSRADVETAVCGVIFNAQGYLHEEIKKIHKSKTNKKINK